MKRKQVIAFVSAAALAVTSLAGCGKTEEKTEKTTVSDAEEYSDDAARRAYKERAEELGFITSKEMETEDYERA